MVLACDWGGRRIKLGRVSQGRVLALDTLSALSNQPLYVLRYMLNEPDVQCVSVCESLKSRREAAKDLVDRRYGNRDCTTYGDLREFLAEQCDIDAVLIASGDRWHALTSVMAMRAGMDVYCEKPACLTMAEGQMVLYRVQGSVWEPCEYWRGACGERFDGPEGWVAAADGYARTDVSSPALLRDYTKLLADYTARTQRPLSHVRDFFNCVRSRRPPVANPEVMYQSMCICLAADICEQLKRNLKLDLRQMEFAGDPEANRMRSRAMRPPFLF